MISPNNSNNVGLREKNFILMIYKKNLTEVFGIEMSRTRKLGEIGIYALNVRRVLRL